MDPKQHFETSYETRTFYPSDDIRFSVYSREMREELLRHLSKESRIADFGCGGGTALRWLEDRGYCRLHGLDFCNVIPDGFLERTQFHAGDVLHAPFEDGSLDAVISTMVIEHVDEQAFAAELHRVLRPGGIALVTSVLKGKFSWYFYRNEKGERVVEPTHLKEYRSEQEFRSVFEKGFEVVMLKKAVLKYPLVDPLFRIMLRLFPGDRMHALPTRNRLLNALRYLRVPIPGYYSIEILVTRK